LTVGHYTTTAHDPFWHDLFRRLYYLPILIAGFRYGLKGGLITAGAVSLLFLPHVIMTRAMLPRQASEAVFEIPLYFLVGVVTGLLADRLRQTTESLRQAERLKAIGEMAAGVAHEVKNPLAAIRSSAQALASQAEGGLARPGKNSELAGIIVDEVDRLNRVVEQLLQYARPAPIRRVPVRPSRLLDAAVGLLAPVASGKKLMVTKLYPDGEPEVGLDEDQLRQVFLNLLLNAIEAAPPESELLLAVETTPDELRISISDKGPGIRAQDMKRIFEPFYTTRKGGTGLGLSIAQRIVETHGGHLMIESDHGSGTTAIVALPIRGAR
jgi:signal transduction histidine kinase